MIARISRTSFPSTFLGLFYCFCTLSLSLSLSLSLISVLTVRCNFFSVVRTLHITKIHTLNALLALSLSLSLTYLCVYSAIFINIQSRTFLEYVSGSHRRERERERVPHSLNSCSFYGSLSRETVEVV